MKGSGLLLRESARTIVLFRTTSQILLAWLFFGIAGIADVHANSIAGSPHDLSMNGEGICVYCHTPMSASLDGSAPLWNRKTSSKTLSMYSSSTLDMTIESAPGGVSLMCLSCHDGSMAYDSLINNPGVANNGVMTGTSAIGADGLANDHPISIEYDPSKDPNFAPVTNGRVGGLPLFVKDGQSGPATQVECSTCHDVHDPGNGNFLRMSNAGSSLCLTCHAL